MKLPLLLWVISQGSNLFIGQPSDGVKETNIDLQTVIRENAKNHIPYKSKYKEEESEYFGLKKKIKTVTKCYIDGDKVGFETKNSEGREYQRVTSNGLVYILKNVGNDKPVEGRPPISGMIYRFPLGIEAGDPYHAMFMNKAIDWNGGVTLEEAVKANDTEVQFSMKKPQEGNLVPVIKLLNKKNNNRNIIGKGEYNAEGYDEDDNAYNRYDLEIWFSPENNFAISKLVYIGVKTKQTYQVQVIDKFREIKSGKFVPEKQSGYTFDSKNKKLVLCSKTNLVKISVDESIPDEKFTLKFPEGASIIDYTKNKIWFANKDGKFDHYLKDSNGLPVSLLGLGDPKFDLIISLVSDPICFFYPAKEHAGFIHPEE